MNKKRTNNRIEDLTKKRKKNKDNRRQSVRVKIEKITTTFLTKIKIRFSLFDKKI